MLTPEVRRIIGDNEPIPDTTPEDGDAVNIDGFVLVARSALFRVISEVGLLTEAMNHFADTANLAMAFSGLRTTVDFVGFDIVDIRDGATPIDAFDDFDQWMDANNLHDVSGADFYVGWNNSSPTEPACGFGFLPQKNVSAIGSSSSHSYSRSRPPSQQVLFPLGITSCQGRGLQQRAETFVHELGHNLGSGHTLTSGDEQGLWPFAHGATCDTPMARDPGTNMGGSTNGERIVKYSSISSAAAEPFCGDAETANNFATIKRTAGPLSRLYRRSPLREPLSVNAATVPGGIEVVLNRPATSVSPANVVMFALPEQAENLDGISNIRQVVEFDAGETSASYIISIQPQASSGRLVVFPGWSDALAVHPGRMAVVIEVIDSGNEISGGARAVDIDTGTGVENDTELATTSGGGGMGRWPILFMIVLGICRYGGDRERSRKERAAYEGGNRGFGSESAHSS